MLCDNCLANWFCSRQSYREIWCPSKDKLDTAISKARIPKRYLNTSLFSFNKDIPTFESVNEAVELLKVKNGVVYIYGEEFSGKTYNGFVILNHYIFDHCLTNQVYERPIALYVDYIDLADSVRNNKEEFEILKTVPLLFIDDVGTIVNDMTVEVFYRIINERYNSELSTVLTSLYSLDELVKYCGKRAVAKIKNSLIKEIKCQTLNL